MLLLEFLCVKNSEEIIMSNSLLYVKTIGIHNRKRIFLVLWKSRSARAKSIFLATTMTACLLRLSSVSMSTSMEIAFDCSFCIRLLLLGSHGGTSSSEVSPDSMDCWNQYTKLGPFFPPLLSTVTFDQMTIKHSLYM